jgi:hypothetical protein
MHYYIRQQRKHISGPHELDAIREWVKQGKVRPEMEFSEDGTTWMLGIEMYELFGDVADPRRGTRRERPRRR